MNEDTPGRLFGEIKAADGQKIPVQADYIGVNSDGHPVYFCRVPKTFWVVSMTWNMLPAHAVLRMETTG
jgi:hypothetical protein